MSRHVFIRRYRWSSASYGLIQSKTFFGCCSGSASQDGYGVGDKERSLYKPSHQKIAFHQYIKDCQYNKIVWAKTNERKAGPSKTTPMKSCKICGKPLHMFVLKKVAIKVKDILLASS
ncbi:hypothetical protein Tsp_09009 [Trichinella spiralis]|uniref:hypothetical protein n=1 Tax=Trichinella spiralis TaxID=6334 RepID=UPI0001EFC560|nr:hypothetical protein Tsp_09009 [Trichinella spiralis]